MKTLTKREFLIGATALSSTLMMATAALAVDLAALNQAPDIGEMTLGAPDAKVTVIEYASATCPHCAAFYNDTFPALKKEYIDTNKIRFVFREYPLDDAALAGFMVARCAPKDKYFSIIEILFATQPKWVPNPLEGLGAIAQQAGFTKDQFDACLKNETVAKQIMAVREKGTGFGISGVPTFFVNGEMMDGEKTIEAMRAKIDPLLK
jgi:protein-disulfide isomerase